jgi:hypothetical protein
MQIEFAPVLDPDVNIARAACQTALDILKDTPESDGHVLVFLTSPVCTGSNRTG